MVDYAQKSPWQQEFDALPEWAQKMVRGLAGCCCYGCGGADHLLPTPNDGRREYYTFHIGLKHKSTDEWFEGFLGMHALAAAMTAPWPPPAPPPNRERQVVNLVELVAEGEDDDCAFDQPCCFGHRVETHAVYCHNEAWPDSPRKCRRNRTDYRHEDCPGFVRNPDSINQPDKHK